MNQEYKCLIDNSGHPTISDLHLHLRKLKWKQSDYYMHYFPRNDLLTNEVIPFKDLQTYFKVDFLNKNNLNKWAKQNPERAIEWVKKYLSERKGDKNLIRAPSHFELRTLFCPSVKFIQEHGDYNKLCDSIGLKPQYDYSKGLVFSELPDNYKIIEDSREQRGLKFINKEVKKLDYGDYTLDKGNNNIFIERKSISDMISSITRDYERFYREVARAKKDGSYIVIGVEVDYSTFASFNYDYRMRFATKATPEHVFKNMRDLLLDFDNIQFVFADGRVELSRIILQIYKLGEQAKTTDLQWIYETGKL
jgi:hypothetical protein